MRVVLTSQEVVVPSLLGKRVREAGAIAGRHRLLLRVEGRRHDPKIPAGPHRGPGAGAGLDAQETSAASASGSAWDRGALRCRRWKVRAFAPGACSLEQAQVPVGRVVEVDDAAQEGTILRAAPARRARRDRLARGRRCW